VVTGTHKHGSP
jgi:hypothetical protein